MLSERPLKDLYLDYLRYRKEDRNPLWSEGFWMICIHRFGRKARMIYFKPLRYMALFPLLVIRKLFVLLTGIIIPFSVRIGGGFFLPHFGCIIIHDDSVIGTNCSIYQGVTLGAKGSKTGGPHLGNFVNVGAGAVILGTVTIGNNVDVGANAVVLTDIPCDSIAVGAPAIAKPKPRKPGERVFA